jgi:signal transduction histidine kinase
MLIDLSSNIYAVILGALLMLGIYHFMMFTQNKKKLYLFYALYVLSFVVYLFERLPNDPLNLHVTNPAIQFLTFAFYVLFARHLLDTKQQNKLLDRVFVYFKNFLYVLAILFLILHLGFPHQIQFKIYFYVIPIFIIVCFVIYGLIFRLKGPDVFYFLVGSLIYFVLSIISFTSTPTSGNISESFLYKQGMHPLFPMYMGVIIENLVFAVLVGNKTKRVEIQKITAEKNIELAQQKNITLLKDQELNAIDAMIQGQEKERQSIANDLHDDLGGLMATVKLHFNALKEKQSPELYDKTNKLLDEAYNKVRSVAHAKNSGVMAKKGLLKALNDMATTVSGSNRLQVDIIDHGLDERLENSVELTIFRITQELITNVIKHANATEASIHITKHEDSLNIMVEDNGNGFNTKDIPKKSGMGIHSIDKRIENLGGKVTIESEIHKGTTIIIDIPL